MLWRVEEDDFVSPGGPHRLSRGSGLVYVTLFSLVTSSSSLIPSKELGVVGRVSFVTSLQLEKKSPSNGSRNALADTPPFSRPQSKTTSPPCLVSLATHAPQPRHISACPVIALLFVRQSPLDRHRPCLTWILGPGSSHHAGRANTCHKSLMSGGIHSGF